MTRSSDLFLASSRFRSQIAEITARAIVQDLPAIHRNGNSASEVDWPYALFASSVLSTGDGRQSKDYALRVAQSCVSSPDTSEEERQAAVVLLERLGNHLAVQLAVARNLVPEDAWTSAPGPLQAEVIRRQISLTVQLPDGRALITNPFQREFWNAVSDARWVSVSAPTSTGKSFIVRQWLAERLEHGPLAAAYLVPSRALIDEVSKGLRKEFGPDVPIYTLPWQDGIGRADGPSICVMTQERLHLVQSKHPEHRFNLVFIDEAQKFDDAARGLLLQQVLDESIRREPTCQVIFATPMASNPELLLDGAPSDTTTVHLVSNTVTVNQNLLWANQVPRKPTRWAIQAPRGNEETDAITHIGEFNLPARATPKSKRLPYVAAGLAGAVSGNIVYVNTQSDAEKIADQLYEVLGANADISGDPAISEAQELIRESVHPQYRLAKTISRGVGFHYGNMPLIVRSEVEELFRQEVLRFLVCTSTLLEGVNLPCKNLFVRGPRRGQGQPMTPADFWNLAGRAGRWGTEFQGNIVCVDTTDQDQWPIAPRRPERKQLSRATDDLEHVSERLVRFVAAGAPVDDIRESPSLEHLFSLLAHTYLQEGTLSGVPWLKVSDSVRGRLEVATEAALMDVQIPGSMLFRHAGISPLSLQRLLDRFMEVEFLDRYALVAPESDDAVDSYVRALGYANRYLGADFGPSNRQWQLAVLVVRWMSGYPLPRIVSERVNYFSGGDRQRKVARVIRESLADVEKYARFLAPRFLAAYADVLRLAAGERGIELEEGPDVAMMLEVGVARTTEMSLIGLGLSRTSAIVLSEYIVQDDLDADGCLSWLRSTDLSLLDIPAPFLREVTDVLDDLRVVGR